MTAVATYSSQLRVPTLPTTFCAQGKPAEEDAEAEEEGGNEDIVNCQYLSDDSDDEEDAEAERIKAERVAAYNAKKANKAKVAAKVRLSASSL